MTLKNRKLLLSFLLILFSSAVPALMRDQNMYIQGWSDDSHLLFRSPDDPGKTERIDVKTGKSDIAMQEKSARARLEESLPQGVSLTFNDAVSADLKEVAILKDNDLYYFHTGDKELKRLTNDAAQEVNARFSPDGRKIAYTKNKDLYVYDLTADREIRLTADASDRVYNGYSSWVYMEEILERSSRYAAFWWAPDGSMIAFLRTDESDVPFFNLNRLDQADGLHGTVEITRYPKAGDPNPKVKMGIADVASGRVTWVKTDCSTDQYIAWPFWTPDSKQLAIQVVNREQNDLQIILADPATGDYRQIYDERYKTWVEFHEDIYVMNDGSGYIIRNYKTGFENLYYYGWNGKLISQLTDLKFRVTGIEKVDEQSRTVYFKADGDESTDSHLFRVGLDGKNLLQISKGSGMHMVSISPKGSYFADTWTSIESPGAIILYDRKGKMIRELYKFRQPAFDPAASFRSELVKIKTSDGLFDMPAIITYPLNFDASKKYPVVFTIYGGPDSRNVYNRWQGSAPSWYAKNGIIQFTVDHRGSGQFARRGLDYMYRSLGKWEILDYEDAVKWLREKPFVDDTRMGITGSSYGGYMTCLALTKGADYWTHGFAGSSVTDFRLYDDIYTERYMGTPQDNPDGYRDGSPVTYVRNYKGKLFITHGDVDDNVHMQNSIWLISKMEDEGKQFEFMVYPDGRHGWGGNKAMHSRNEANNFWLKNFFGK